MCGIAGAAWATGAEPIDRALLKQMADSIAHRGPDDEGFHLEPGVALAHRRLSIIDLAGGHQPLDNEDGSVWTVFNGEIYNYKELRSRLTGHQFKTDSDTEVIVHLYEELGPDCVREFRGMFALAIWDRNRRRLILARDRVGKKPLVYRHDAGRILFGSENKAILQIPDVQREVDPTALHDYLAFSYVPHPRTIYRGIAKLPPGHYAVFENGALRLQRYWNPDLNHEEQLPAAEFGRRLRETMTEATRLRLRSDVPLGAFLSGGLDSTIVVGLMQEQSTRPVQTFSIGFPVTGFDETEYARAVAQHLGTEHREFVVTPDSIEILPKLVWHYDEPFADSSAIPTFYLSQYTREHVTVALNGDGGDELFAGYERYLTYAQITRWGNLPPPIPALLRSRFWDLLPSGGRQQSVLRRIQYRLATLRESPQRRYVHWVRLLNRAMLNDLYTDDFRAELANHDECALFEEAFARCARRDPLTQGTLVDLQIYLPGALLAKVDIASMAFALECRSPLLDQEVVELAARMPVGLKVNGSVRKQILRDAFADLMPPSVRGRGKMGFCVPLDHWFRHELRELVHEVLLDPVSIGRGYFRRERIERLLAQHMAGDWQHGDVLWSLLFLEHWHRMFIDAPQSAEKWRVKSGEWRAKRPDGNGEPEALAPGVLCLATIGSEAHLPAKETS